MTADELVRAITDALHAHDADTFAGLYAPNVTVYDPQFPPFHGREEVVQNMKDSVEAVSDFHFEIAKVLSDGDQVAFYGTGRGTQVQVMETPNGPPEPTGRTEEWLYAVFLRTDASGLIVEERRFIGSST